LERAVDPQPGPLPASHWSARTDLGGHQQFVNLAPNDNKAATKALHGLPTAAAVAALGVSLFRPPMSGATSTALVRKNAWNAWRAAPEPAL
jgi:hypothetical protein